MDTPIEIPAIRNITISGRIGSGTTTLAKHLSEGLHWELLEGGVLFERFHDDLEIHEQDSNKRPDELDLKYEEMIKDILRNKTQRIIQSHLAGFDAQEIDGVFKILVQCVDDEGRDMQDIRIDRLVNRKQIHVSEAKEEVKTREKNNLDKWRRLYAENDPNWVYWDPKYYDLIVNSFDHNAEESLEIVLQKLGIK